MAATAMLVLMLVALPLAPEPYRTMTTAVFRSSVPVSAIMFLGLRSSPPPMPAMAAPAAVAAPKRATP